MKSSKILIFVVTLFLFLCSNSMLACADELYFNDNGDLVFSTYDKKASSSTRYRTVGWVVKRYDDGIYAANQQSMTITKSGYLYTWEDPNNPNYIYSTFIIPGQTIMNQMGRVSGEWKQQIMEYGGYVYIDSIMTIVQNNVEQGYLDAQGVYYGEVYNTYEGIRNARAWADGGKLANYYGLQVKYPYKITTLQSQIVVTTIENAVKGSVPEGDFRINSDEFNVEEGIPAGEYINIKGKADAFLYQVKYRNIAGFVNIPVKVITTYNLRWVDSGGQGHSENQQVERWYYVRRNFSYAELISSDVLNLKNTVISSENINSVKINNTEPGVNSSCVMFGEAAKHLLVNRKYSYANAGVKVIQSRNNQRPSIPMDNQQNLADSTIGELTVWSDRLTINGKLLLSSTPCAVNGKRFIEYDDIPDTNISAENIAIRAMAQNKVRESVGITLQYDSAKNRVKKDVSAGNIRIHTPVVSVATLSGNKKYNENIAPRENEVVIGEKFTISLGTLGQHLDIKGYGLRNYAPYIRNRYVSFPFSVVYKNRYYDAGCWILINTSSAAMKVSEEVQEGTYQMKCMVVAQNGPNIDGVMDAAWNQGQDTANIDINKYIARASAEINVIGKIYGLTVSNEGKREKVGNHAIFPENVVCQEDTLPFVSDKLNSKDDIYKIQLYANGIGDETGENVEMQLSYAVMEEDVRKAVDVYYAVSDVFNKDTLIKLTENIRIEPWVELQQGVFGYEYDLYIPDRLVVVDAGRNIADINMESDYIIRDRDIIVNADIYGDSGQVRKLSYENPVNAARGYCNMWRMEGYSLNKYDSLALKYGDIILIKTKDLYENHFRVIGTH